MRYRVRSLIVYDCLKTEMGKVYALIDPMECFEAYPKHIRSHEHMHYHMYHESGFLTCISKRTYSEKSDSCISLWQMEPLIYNNDKSNLETVRNRSDKL